MDERIRTVRNMAGQLEVRVKHEHLDQENHDWLYNELLSRGFLPADLGQYQIKGSTVHIPIRRDNE